MLVCAYNVHSCTRDRGCSAHPAFPAPSLPERGNELENLGRKHAARRRTRIYPHVVPAKAGTHAAADVVLKRWLTALPRQLDPVVIGPGFRRDDVRGTS